MRNGRNGSIGNGVVGTMGLGVVVVWIMMIAGWITNFISSVIYVFNDSDISVITAFEVIQLLGVFVAPVGAVLGIVSWF